MGFSRNGIWKQPSNQINMNEEILQRLEAHMEASEKKIDAIYESVRKMQLYFKWTLIITVVLFVLPLIAIALILPTFINNITNIYGI